MLRSPLTTHHSPLKLIFGIFFLILFLLFLSTKVNAQIKVWYNSNVSMGYQGTAPTQQLHVFGDFYQVPNNSLSGFYFENYSANPPFNEPILRPQWAMTAWLGNANYEFYRVFATHMYTSFGQVQTSDRRLKTNIRVWNGSALNQVMRLNIYRYDMNPAKFNNVPDEKMEQVTEEAKNKIGFIAQELQEEFPEMVSIIPGTDYLGVDYSMMIPILLEAIKEQQALILELQTRVLELEKR